MAWNEMAKQQVHRNKNNIQTRYNSSTVVKIYRFIK